MIRVTLINPADRRFWQAQWDDPITGKTKTRSTKTTIKREAERFAGRLEDELNAGTYKPLLQLTWAEFRERYINEVSSTKRPKTRLKTEAMFNAVEELLSPKFLSAFADASTISKYAEKLKKGRKPDTVDGHLREIRKVLRWAVRMNMLREMPHIEFPGGLAGMKGRPITAEEFDRMKDAVKKSEMACGCFDEWMHFIKGLWLSGLRLDEAMLLHWTDCTHLAVDFSHRRPMFRIRSASDKGGKDRLLPMAPDFAEFLKQTPMKDRHGLVFNPLTRGPAHDKTLRRPTTNHAGRVVSDFGAIAKIKVNESKFASSHDLRRAFGVRWAKLVMPKILQELMRHADIKTTMKYYVGAMAEDAADAVWQAMQRSGNSSGNSPQDPVSEAPSQPAETA